MAAWGGHRLDRSELQPRTVLYLHSSAGRYGADRQLALMAGGLDRERYRPLVVLPHGDPLTGDLRAAGVELLVRPHAARRRAARARPPGGRRRTRAGPAGARAGGRGRPLQHLG
ncbi:MAG TPA: hypothetical protein VHR88_01135 [Solirubrobacteraceae bacterium]|jgi:hypothetical protein|nr:hypothetical protein [Solirubrobacteraceae bacterium]